MPLSLRHHAKNATVECRSVLCRCQPTRSDGYRPSRQRRLAGMLSRGSPVSPETRASEPDKTALSWWFPKIEAAGLPVPRTTLLTIPDDAAKSIWEVFDGKPAGGAGRPFFDAIRAAAESFGYPCFLRTDYTSGKHSWEDTCLLASTADIPRHVYAIAEFSECADMIGLPWSVWAVRELLPTRPLGVCRDYGNMPICREFRFFVDDGAVRCWHPYWPLDSLEAGGAPSTLDYESLCRVDDESHLVAIAEAACRAVGGSWSVDILDTARGWFVTDMAEANRSFHWPDCGLRSSGQRRM